MVNVTKANFIEVSDERSRAKAVVAVSENYTNPASYLQYYYFLINYLYYLYSKAMI